MAKIFKTSDRLPIKIHNFEFKISPLTFAQRAEVQSHLVKAHGGDLSEATVASFKAIKFSIKEMKGITCFDGTDYTLEFTDGVLTDECANDLLNLEIYPELTSFTTSLINGVPDQVLDDKGLPVKGISLLYRDGAKRPNSKKAPAKKK